LDRNHRMNGKRISDKSQHPRRGLFRRALSERELEVIRLIAEGRSNQEIAETPFVALSTIKWRVNNTYGKLNVRSRTQAMARAQQLGLL